MSKTSAEEKGFTRSPISEGASMVALSCASTPSSTAKDAQGFSKCGRKVLADLACNDSPVIGLLPPGTPASCKQKSSSSIPVQSRRALLPTLPSSTPLGESLLRSQVQLLLQKVESDVCAPPCPPRVNQFSNVHAGFMVSPTMLAAPTPSNTPAAMAPTMQASQSLPEGVVKNVSTDEALVQGTSAEGTCVQSIDGNSQGTFGILKGHVLSGEQPPVQTGSHAEVCHRQNVLSASDSSTAFVSTTTMCQDSMRLLPSPLLSEVSGVSSPSEIFPGKRVLYFDDDTPCKASPRKQFDTMDFEESGSHSSVIDDDELSEWSVHVNVGSPADKQSLIEQADCTVLVENGSSLEAHDEVSSSIHEHVKNTQQKSSGKVDLLWRKARERKATPYRRENELYEEDEGDAEYVERYDYGHEEELEQDDDDDEGECDNNLCDMFKGMGFGDGERKHLPRGEGTHIRFLYEEGEDEIVDAMVVKGEEEVLCDCKATRLNGLPAPLGRHLRFVHEDEEKGEGASRP